MKTLAGFVLVVGFLAAAWWFSFGGSTDVSAEAVVYEACEKSASEIDFDMAVRLDIPGDLSYPGDQREVWEVKTIVSGENFHSVTHISDGPAFLEIIRVDGTDYIREGTNRGDGEWKGQPATPGLNDLGYLTIPFDSPKLEEGANPLCPGLGSVSKVGEETITGVQTTRYSSFERLDMYGGNYADTTWDFWIDEGGQLMRTRVYADIDLADGGEDWAEVITTVSGIGEANIIAAPTP